MPNYSMNDLFINEHRFASEQPHSELDQEQNSLPSTETYRGSNPEPGPEYDSQVFSAAIISSSCYPIPEPLHLETAKVSDGPGILYGGLSVYNEDNAHQDDNLAMDPLEQPPQTRFVKKRSKNRAVPADGDSSRKRGRPRILTKDETATERRRTQVRLAQRAYRLRKEATIFSLNNRVAELEATIEEMSESFVSFNDQIMASSLLPSQPALALSLRNVTGRFLSLARLSKKQSNPEVGLSAESQRIEYAPATQKYRSNDLIGEAWNVAFQRAMDSVGREADDINVSHQNIMPFVSDGIPERRPKSDNVQNIGAIAVDNRHSTDVLFPGISVEEFRVGSTAESPISTMTPYVYNFEESAFARRLHRSCLERGYRLLTDPSVDPEELLRTFTFSFVSSNRKRLISRFRKLLDLDMNEAVETPNMPLFHLGGPQTHYPRGDEQGSPLYPENMHSITEAVGSWPFHLAETPHEGEGVESLLAAPGFDGDWYDPHDVEGFLREKGIVLNGHSSLVDLPQGRLLSVLSGEQMSCQNTVDDPQKASNSIRASPRKDLADASVAWHMRLPPRPKARGNQLAIAQPYDAPSTASPELLDPQGIMSITPGSLHENTLRQARISERSRLKFDVDRFIDRKSPLKFQRIL